MKIKQSTFYAFRILCRLDKEKNRVVTSKTIAEEEALSQGMTLKILQIMGHGGIVYSHQGRDEISGGFSLAKSIDNITVFDVVRVLEGADICENLDRAFDSKEEQIFSQCSQINEEVEKLLSKYTIRSLFNNDEIRFLAL